jgi:hypothetical protein
MSQAPVEYDGNNWEHMVKTWLRIRHGGSFEELPADHGGDFGLEGFSRDGIAYQCYAVREPLKAGELYENQRSKITADIAKFIRNRRALSNIFGDITIQSWWLIVPEHKSAKLTQHAQKKQQEVRDASLPYVAPEFFIHIATPEDFAVEHREALAKNLYRIQLIVPEVTPQQVADWADPHDATIQRLDAKIGRLLRTTDAGRIRHYRAMTIGRYLAGENSLEALRSQSADLWERIEHCRRHREKFVALECAAPMDIPPVTLASQQAKLHDDISGTVPGLHPRAVDEIVYGIQSAWMIECNLDFPDT